MNHETFNLVWFGIFIILALVLFYQSWMNLVQKQLTKISFDALILLYLRILRGEQSVRKAKKLLVTEPKRLRILGIVALVSGIISVYEAIDWYIKYLGE